MEQSVLEYLHNYELTLTQRLLGIAENLKFSSGQLYSSEDLNNAWSDIAPDYMADAIPNIADYPKVSIAWAGYIGFALARMWDDDWSKVNPLDTYSTILKSRGFDEMDEFIVEEILGYNLSDDKAIGIENLMRSLSETALNLIRHEQVEPQSELAFHIFARTVRAMFHIGVSCELYSLGYKWSRASL